MGKEYDAFTKLTKREQLEFQILKKENSIGNKRESYDTGNVFYNKSELLCDITMEEVKLEDLKEELKQLKSEEIK
jgi:hypothetical protein